jgi:hypothetical protein
MYKRPAGELSGWLAMGLDEMSPLTSDDDAAITLGCITLTVIYC